MERTEQATIPIIVLDTGPIIHLDELDSLYLLSDFKKLLVPDAVWREIERHRPSAVNDKNIVLEKIQVLQDINTHIPIVCNSFNLDAGETEAIILCSKYPNSILLTDDAAARLATNALGLRAYGTIGILLRAIRRKQLAPVDVIRKLDEIPLKSTLFIKNSLLQEIIEKVKK